MASSLQLRLERVISASRLSNALELPLDRKLGDLSRYTYVYADALPLRMERRISEQPASNALYLALSQPLGTLASVMYVTSDALPLPLTELISEQPPANALPLGLTRKLGTVTGSYVPPVTPPVSNDVSASITAIANITPTASASVTAEVVSVSVAVIARAELNPAASATAIYDANVFRGVMADTSSGIQNAKLQSITATDGFERNAQLNTSTASDYQQSQLVSDDNQAQFEANAQLQSSHQAAFEPSKLIGDGTHALAESLRYIADKTTLKNEASRLVGDSDWLSFEAMAKRQIERIITHERGYLIGDHLSTASEYGALIGLNKQSRAEFARLPYSKLRYIPPPLWQTVILPAKPEDNSGAAFTGDEAKSYVYDDKLPLPMTRPIAGRNLSSHLAMPMTMPRGVLIWRKSENGGKDLLPIWSKDRLARVNKIDDVVMCKPKAFGTASGITVTSNAMLDAWARLELLAEALGSAYGSGVIFVTNSVSLTRTDDGRNINLFDFSVGIDSNSYCWTFSASVPLAELSKVNTANEARIGVDLTVNGHLWRFILDGCDDTIAFGERSLSIKGKSRAMLLANPYARQRGYKFDTPLSARQIADDELNRGGIPSGFTLDWDLVGVNGWSVPANTYSYSNKTPINSLQWIAEAAGGFINSDMSADIIHVKELYKIPSWEWSAQTPLLTLPQSLILNRSQNRINKPAYNGVQVWGEKIGSVGALIKRTGTAGSYAPPMVTSDLITTNEVARSRGIAILSDTGDMADVNITMPLHADFGILKPATLIGVNDGEQWVGMVRGTSIKGKLSSQQTLEIEQSLSIERHFEGA